MAQSVRISDISCMKLPGRMSVLTGIWKTKGGETMAKKRKAVKRSKKTGRFVKR